MPCQAFLGTLLRECPLPLQSKRNPRSHPQCGLLAHPLLLPLLLSGWDSPLPCRNPPWLCSLIFTYLGVGGTGLGWAHLPPLSPHPSLPCPTTLNSLRVHNDSIPSHMPPHPTTPPEKIASSLPHHEFLPIPQCPSSLKPFPTPRASFLLGSQSLRPASSPLDAPSTHSMLLQNYGCVHRSTRRGPLSIYFCLRARRTVAPQLADSPRSMGSDPSGKP